jgi:hypothetical protein
VGEAGKRARVKELESKLMLAPKKTLVEVWREVQGGGGGGVGRGSCLLDLLVRPMFFVLDEYFHGRDGCQVGVPDR